MANKIMVYFGGPFVSTAGRMMVLVAWSTVLLSACTVLEKRPVVQDALLEDLPLLTTSSEQIESTFGTPTAITVSGEGDLEKTSWSYATERLGTHPLRFLPFVGGLVVADVADVEDASFAVSFSQNGSLEGVTQRKLGVYTNVTAWPGDDEEIKPYGWRNLNARPLTDQRETY